MIIFPNAKINIGLFVTEHRNDGFHNIETIFYPINLTDILEIQETPANQEIVLQNTGIHIDVPFSQNLCHQAYRKIKDNHDIPSVDMHLHKIIPPGSGLGGGSSDAAYTLLTLNKIFKLNLSQTILASYAESLGSDCPFFLHNESAFAYEKGNRIIPVPINLTGYYLIVIVPDIQVSTKFAYKQVKPHKNKISLKDIITNMPVEKWKHNIVNDFEYHVFKQYPLLEDIKKQLYELNAEYAAMSGSGSGIYGIFKDKPDLSGKFNDMFVWQQTL
ncbi:MAG: 4-(cytidine 5'-diphospho)-2-C-methyl-D-erythritol kinase [Bacteroidales bacterium]